MSKKSIKTSQQKPNSRYHSNGKNGKATATVVTESQFARPFEEVLAAALDAAGMKATANATTTDITTVKEAKLPDDSSIPEFLDRRGELATVNATTETVAPTDIGSTVATNPEVIKFDDAVREGKKAFAKFEGSVREANMRLGEIAAKTERKYGESTLDKLGEQLAAALTDKRWAGVFSNAGEVMADDGVAGCTLGRTLARNMSVYLAWDGAGKQAPAPVSWAVLRELQSHPDREALVAADPHMTKAKAHGLLQEDKNKTEAAADETETDITATDITATETETADGEQNGDDNNAADDHADEEHPQWWRHNERWLRDVWAHAVDVSRLAKETASLAAVVGQPMPPEQKKMLRDTIEGKLMSVLWKADQAQRKAADDLDKLYNFLEQLRSDEPEEELAPVISASAQIAAVQSEASEQAAV